MKDKLALKSLIVLSVVVVIVALVGYFLNLNLIFSNVMFMVGLVCLSLVAGDILRHASLFSGWFNFKKNGESKEEYMARKIDVKSVATKKNSPIYISKFTVNGTVVAVILIVLAILLTI